MNHKITKKYGDLSCKTIHSYHTAYQQLPVNVILIEKSNRGGFCEYFCIACRSFPTYAKAPVGAERRLESSGWQEVRVELDNF
jgi:hypothetical protein